MLINKPFYVLYSLVLGLFLINSSPYYSLTSFHHVFILLSLQMQLFKLKVHKYSSNNLLPYNRIGLSKSFGTRQSLNSLRCFMQSKY
jgi:hypothetical protein